MPRISEFYGIVIAMYWEDHPPAHFHAVYGDHQAKVAITTGVVIAGSLPARQLRLVRQWSSQHTDELLANWVKAQKRLMPDRIEPLP